MLDEIQVEISKAANGQDYIQIRSPAAMPVNIVLVATRVVVMDRREPAKTDKPKRTK